MNGFLVVDKPSGMTSHDVIARCRRALSVKRIGHAGTLDPMATGVLLIGVGRAARLLRFLEAEEKEYRARAVLGVTTTTQDAEGDVIAEQDASQITPADLEAILAAFRGEIQQVPPMVSAVKVGGERLYKKARRGEAVERAARPVTVHALELESFGAGEAQLRIVCSKGTYIRTLVADIGEALGVGAHLGALRRTRAGSFTEAEAIPLGTIDPGAVRPMGDAVAGYPRRAVETADARALVQGRVLPAAGIEGPYAVFGPDGLVAMAEDQGEVARSLCVVMEG